MSRTLTPRMRSTIAQCMGTPLTPVWATRAQLSAYVLSARQAKHDMLNPSASHGLRIAARAAYHMFCKRIQTELHTGARHRN